MTDKVLPQTFYGRDPATVARELLGRHLIRRSREGVTMGRIVEVEAYLATSDSSCHAARGRTKRNQVMFGRPGLLYVYSIHSRWCLNVVTEAKGVPSAVLIRAVEPMLGASLMAVRRNTSKSVDLARGPGRLCEAFSVDRRLDGWDLTRGQRIWLTTGSTDDFASSCGKSPRIGVTSAKQLELRFFINGSKYVSGPRHLHSRASNLDRGRPE